MTSARHSFAGNLAAWAGCLALAAALSWGEGIIGWANPWAAAALIVLAVALLWRAPAPATGAGAGQAPSARLVLPALVLVVVGWFLGHPFGSVAVLVAIALLASSHRRGGSLASAALLAAWLIGLWWLLYHLLGARFHELPGLAPTLAAVLRGLGLDAAAQGHLVHVQGADFHLPFALSWPSLGDWALLVFLLCPIAARLAGWPRPFAGTGGVGWMRLLVALLGYCLLRLVVQTVAILEVPERFQLVYYPALQALSFIPILPLLAWWCPLVSPDSALARPKSGANILALGVAAFGLGVALFWIPAGPAHSGRLLIDETHSDWELTTERLDTRWYGEYSTYNYWCLARWLGHYRDVSVLRRGRLDAPTLADADILLLKCPTRPYEPDEVAAILAFVRSGGGIILVGDHTNVLGMSGYLNQIAEPMGLRFNYDATYDFRTGGLSIYEPPLRVRHPIVRRLAEFDFMTSCTIDTGLRGRAVIVGPGLLTGQVDFATPHFFDRQREFLLPDVLLGLFTQAAAGDYGRGRFYLWADSTCWSNFSVFMDGLPPMLLGALAFVSRQAPLLDGRLTGLLIILLAAASALIDRRRNPAVTPLALALALLLGLMVAAYGAMAYNAVAYRHQSPIRPMNTVAFDLRHGDFALRPASGMARNLGILMPNDLDLSTFYVWTQRVGLVPREARAWSDLLSADAVILPQPGPGLTPRAADRLIEWVKSGGRLLLLLDPAHVNTRASLLLDPLGLHAVPAQRLVGLRGKGSQASAAFALPVFSLVGGTPLWNDDAGRVVATVLAVGRGKVVVCGAAGTFNASIMGGSFTEPDKTQAQVYELEYSLLKALTEGLPSDRRL
jgi:hypothetical protein